MLIKHKGVNINHADKARSSFLLAVSLQTKEKIEFLD